MVEREVRSIAEIADFIYQVKKGKKIKLEELGKASGVSQVTIMHWKSEMHGANVNSVIKVLSVLDVQIVLYTDELKEERVQVAGDIVSFIDKVLGYKKISIVETCEKLEFSINTFNCWRKNENPNINNAIKVLLFLNAKMVLRVDGLEDECTESENTEEVETRDMEHGETEVSELDMLILGTAEKALKKCNSLSEKERLYKVLQAFI